MFLNVFQFTALVALVKPTQTTAPILQCVVLTGRPILLQANTVKALPSSIVNPLKRQERDVLGTPKAEGRTFYLAGLISVSPLPTVYMTRCPKTQSPMHIPTAP